MADDKGVLVPEIRFKGFTDAWEKRKWTDTVEISTNMVDPKTGDFDELLHVGPGNIESFSGQLLNNVKTVKEEKLISSKFHFNNGDIIYGKINPQLAKYIHSDFEGLCSADAYVLNSKNGLEQNFLFRILQNKPFYDYSVSVSQRTGMPKINRDELNQYAFFIPTIPEQTAIGNFFRTLDDIITLHKRKLDGLKKLKNGYLQQMFPQAGEIVPRVRFAGFIEPWAQRRLGEVVEKLKSYPLSRDVESDIATGYRYIHYGDIHKKHADIITNDEQLPRIKVGDYVPLQRGDIIVADASEDYTGIAEPSVIFYEPIDKIIAGLHTIAMRPIEADSLYLYYLLHTEHFKKFGGETGTGLKVFGISFNNLVKYETSYPDRSEQTAIGHFFRNLDKQIDTQQKKLNQLKQLKMAYLQKMFI